MSSPRRPSFLCVAYAFPPINRSGTYRTAGFVEQLDTMGWDASVITVKPGDELVDRALSDALPSNAAVYRAGWLDLVTVLKQCRHPFGPSKMGGNQRGKHGNSSQSRQRAKGLTEWVSRLLKTPDSRLGWVLPGALAALHAVQKRRPSVLYSTSPYASAHLIALLVSHRTRIPWVVDFRDPWHDNPFKVSPFRSLDRWDGWLESVVLKRASHVVVNTPAMLDRLQVRVPHVRSKSSTILNGFDPAVVASVVPTRSEPVGDFVITHCGQFYGRRSPIPWFDALKRACRSSEALARRLRFVQVGADHFDGRPLMHWAKIAGVDDLVRVVGPRSHAQALAHMAGSDALALAGSVGGGNDLQIPNKLFEYLAMQKPIIATVSSNGAVADIMGRARAQAVICEPTDAPAIADGIIALANGTAQSPTGLWAGVDQYSRTHRAQELLTLFERIRRDCLPTQAVVSVNCSIAALGMKETQAPTPLMTPPPH